LLDLQNGFSRFAEKAGIPDAARCRIRDSGDLGGGVINQRIARAGQGKSGGFRTPIVLRAGARAVFVHGVAKNEQENIGTDELVALRKLARELLSYDEPTTVGVAASGTLVEVNCDESTVS